jgi:hypothetical protein
MRWEVMMLRRAALVFVGSALAAAAWGAIAALASGDPELSDDFESGPGRWEIVDIRTLTALPEAGGIVDSGDPAHGHVLSMKAGQGMALIKGSEGWTNYSLEGEVCFPRGEASLMGLVYHLNALPRPGLTAGAAPRIEFGSIYIKCGGSYVRVNPHYDGTAGRALYEEYATDLTGAAAVRVGEWQRFRYEVVGANCHLYVGPVQHPQVTFDGYAQSAGRVGLRPRSGGDGFWVDNVRVRPLAALSYRGRVPTQAEPDPSALLTRWRALGPFAAPVAEIEAGRDLAEWRPFNVDRRGCVISGRICDFQEPGRRVAYFRTTVRSREGGQAKLRFSSRSALEVFVNGAVVGAVDPVEAIWPDFWRRPRHRPTDLSVTLRGGDNSILVRVTGGQYPGCGFYARLEP